MINFYSFMKKTNASIFKHAGQVANRLLWVVAVCLLGTMQLMAQTTITGRVTDETQNALSGVSVVVKGTSNGTTTDANGNFTISAGPNSTLVFSYVGYGTIEQRVGSNTTINLSLVPSAQSNLNEIVVIGYGTAAKRDLTGSITKVSGKEVQDRPNTNPVASLQGKVAGLSVVNSGTPGQEPDIRIRGTVSIGAVKPLYVVDGIFQDNIDFLNPNDIESIEILKDPSSLAIFGIRGATGVIAITTKRAKAGQLLINFNTNFGAKKMVDKIKMVDAAGFKTLFQEEEINIGVPVQERFDFSKWNGNTDWVDALTRTGLFTNNNISLTGSTDRNRFYMSGGYTKEQGIVRRQELEKLTLSINDEFKVSNALKLGFNLNGMRQDLPFSQAEGLLFDARRVLPITPAFSEQHGVYTELAIQAAQMGNPLMNLENKWNKEKRVEYRLVGNIYADVTFLRNFNFRSTFYADRSNLDEQRYNPILYTYNPVQDAVYVDRNNRTTSVNQNSQQWRKYQMDHILTYRNRFGSHSLTATGGFTTFYSDYTGLFASVSQNASGDPIPNDPRFWHINNGFGDQSTQRSSSGQWEKTTVSGLFRALYNYDNRYYLNASFRRDAASQISPQNRAKNFYSVGAAWEMTREAFMANQDIFNFLKLKASWGVLGGQNTYGFDYPFYPALQSGNTAVFGNILAPAYSQAYNPRADLTWETNIATEVGFEARAFKNRLSFEMAYFHKKTEDVMTLINDGTGRLRLDNVGEVLNKGFEFMSSWTQRMNRDLTFTISGNLTTFNNKVLALGGDRIAASEERPNQTEAGYPIGYFYGYVVEGIYQSYADKLKSPPVVGYSYGPGDLKYKDVDGNGVIDSKDRTMIGNPTPDFSYGITFNTAYKNVELSIDMNGVYGNEVYRFWGSSELPFTTFNYPAFKMNRWTGEGTSNWDPALGANRAINRLPSTYGIEDGSYFRFRNIQLAYSFGAGKLGKAVKSLRVFGNVQNLKTFKRNSGYTPEFGGTATSFGIDNGNGLVPMVITGGINVNF
ncbi:TonB-dependent receptor [Flavisolibacter sp. BT320]|nr:TonB-dependent receptor [Flavisolibacter longurius]